MTTTRTASKRPEEVTAAAHPSCSARGATSCIANRECRERERRAGGQHEAADGITIARGLDAGGESPRRELLRAGNEGSNLMQRPDSRPGKGEDRGPRCSTRLEEAERAAWTCATSPSWRRHDGEPAERKRGRRRKESRWSNLMHRWQHLATRPTREGGQYSDETLRSGSGHSRGRTPAVRDERGGMARAADARYIYILNTAKA